LKYSYYICFIITNLKTKVMKKAELIQIAASKGYTVEDEGEMVGIRKTKRSAVWHWFKVHTFLDGTEDVDFHHTYSCNTGETSRGLKHSMDIKSSLDFYK